MITQTTSPSIEEILPEHHRQALSANATRLYQAIWLRMAYTSQTDLWMADDEASSRARVLMKDVSAAQSELVRANLLFLTPGVNQTRYEFIADPDADVQPDGTP